MLAGERTPEGTRQRTWWPPLGAGGVGGQAGKFRVVDTSFPPRKFLAD